MDKLLFQDVQQIVTFVAADSHNSEEQLLVNVENPTVSFAFTNECVAGVKEVFQILWKPTKNTFMWSNSSVSVKDVI